MAISLVRSENLGKDLLLEIAGRHIKIFLPALSVRLVRNLRQPYIRQLPKALRMAC